MSFRDGDEWGLFFSPSTWWRFELGRRENTGFAFHAQQHLCSIFRKLEHMGIFESIYVILLALKTFSFFESCKPK